MDKTIGKVVMEFNLEEIEGALQEIKEALESEEWQGNDDGMVALMLTKPTEDYMRLLGKAIILLEQAYGGVAA